MAENYVRPPLVATEPRSLRAAAWRLRLLALVLVLALAAVVALVLHHAVGGGADDPGVGSDQSLSRTVLAPTGL